LYEPVVEQQVAALMRRAKYKSQDMGRGETYVHGEIPEIMDVYTGGKTMTECQERLADLVRRWVLLRIARGQEIPIVE
jgi:predicted RNase H-like HicB family nuclease